MFRLYDLDLMKLIKVDENESTIINKIGEYLEDNVGARLLIKYHNEEYNQDEIYKIITTVGQYYDYVNEFNQKRLEDMSCMELKRQMLGIAMRR